MKIIILLVVLVAISFVPSSFATTYEVDLFGFIDPSNVDFTRNPTISLGLNGESTMKIDFPQDGHWDVTFTSTTLIDDNFDVLILAYHTNPFEIILHDSKTCESNTQSSSTLFCVIKSQPEPVEEEIRDILTVHITITRDDDSDSPSGKGNQFTDPDEGKLRTPNLWTPASDYPLSQVSYNELEGSAKANVKIIIEMECNPLIETMSNGLGHWSTPIDLSCNQEYYNISIFAKNDSGDKSDTVHYTLRYVITSVEEDPIIVKEELKKKGGGCNDCTPPTLGINSNGKRMVDDGVQINGETIQVDYFYTEMPMQYTEIGKNNTLSFKIYENNGPHNIKHFQLGLGVLQVGSSINESQALIEVKLGHFKDDIYNPVIEKINIKDPDGIIGEYNVTLDLTSCIDEVYSEDIFNPDVQHLILDCLLVEITYNYAKVPISPVLAVNSWDYGNATFDHFFNDGITVIDPNPPIIEEIIIEKYTCKDPIQNNMNRNNCNFRALTEIWK